MYGSSPKTPQSPTSPRVRINTTPASSEQPQHSNNHRASAYTPGSNVISMVPSPQSELNNQSKGGLTESYVAAIGGERGRSMSVPGR